MKKIVNQKTAVLCAIMLAASCMMTGCGDKTEELVGETTTQVTDAVQDSAVSEEAEQEGEAEADEAEAAEASADGDEIVAGDDAEMAVIDANEAVWTECTQQEAQETCPRLFKAPEGATDISWSKSDEGEKGTVQLTYTLDGINFVARARYAAAQDERIDDLTCSWDVEDDVTLANWGEGNMQGKSYRAVGDEETVDLITWYDIEIGIGYSLTVSAPDLDGFDIQAVAENMYDETQEPKVE
ncbi:MAG: hypothetical protein K5739_06090 [Lachnospiraceae bacterium]|nr:hypothetical protein [Lachnospiraceae bacterium]